MEPPGTHPSDGYPPYATSTGPQVRRSSSPVRLLDTSTLTFVQIPPGEAPYAILSHTWTLGTEEVLYRDIHQDTSRTKAGWIKIIGACRQAKKDGLAFLWADTCCIDKSNNSELSEAINSMFAWYRDAAVCYVHLADVSVSSAWWDERETLRSATSASWRAVGHVRFSHSRWFHRGWTLQELLAPTFVRFYTLDWTFLGALYPLRHTISYITGIPTDVLGHEKALRECSIAQRLSWASSRQVSKVEDNAYSLLGILGVHMSLNYGEGTHAFVRLQEEVLGRSNELSVLAWGIVDPLRRSALLAESPADFRDCGDIVLDPSASTSEHYWTSRGLKGTFAITTMDRAGSEAARTFLSLHCRLETVMRVGGPVPHNLGDFAWESGLVGLAVAEEPRVGRKGTSESTAFSVWAGQSWRPDLFARRATLPPSIKSFREVQTTIRR
ncbi:hypothetical protein LTR17_006514 [Elasticomyces elasticus]|nr:hypothetical protein LTR17_006514 [Elasticomyces elasticus]